MSFSPSKYACGIEAEVVGKPSPEYFKSALQEMGLEAHQVGVPSPRARVEAAVLGEAQGAHAGAAVGPEMGLGAQAAQGRPTMRDDLAGKGEKR